MLGDSYNGVDQQRSNDHQIEIVDDEFSPRLLKASVEGSSVMMNWKKPLNLSFPFYLLHRTFTRPKRQNALEGSETDQLVLGITFSAQFGK